MSQQGRKVAVALIGAVVPYNQHDSVGESRSLYSAQRFAVLESFRHDLFAGGTGTRNRRKRHTRSRCRCKTGHAFAEYLGKNDVIYEIGITPNRADCLSHIALPREIGDTCRQKKFGFPDATFRRKRTSRTRSGFYQN